MRALCEANSPDDGSPGCFASLSFRTRGCTPCAAYAAIPARFGWESICLHRQFPIQSLKRNTQILPLVRKAGGIFYLQIKEESTMPTTEKLKQEIADAEKKLAQERSRLRRLIASPLRCGRRLVGFVGVDNPRTSIHDDTQVRDPDAGRAERAAVQGAAAGEQRPAARAAAGRPVDDELLAAAGSGQHLPARPGDEADARHSGEPAPAGLL